MNLFQLDHQRCKKQLTHGPFVVNEANAEVVCKTCGEKLNPMWVLASLAKSEARNSHRLEKLQEQVRETETKMRCKCEHCGKMTRTAKDKFF